MLCHGVDLVGDEPVSLPMHGVGGLGVRGLDQTEDLAGTRADIETARLLAAETDDPCGASSRGIRRRLRNGSALLPPKRPPTLLPRPLQRGHQNMRRALPILAIAMLLVFAAACGDDDATTDGGGDTATTTSATDTGSGDTADTTDDDVTDDGGGNADTGDMGGDSYMDVTVDGTTIRFTASEDLVFSPIEGVSDITFEECDPNFFGVGFWFIGYPVDSNGELVLADDGQNIAGIVTAGIPFEVPNEGEFDFEFDLDHEPLGIDARYRPENGSEYSVDFDGNRASGSVTLADVMGETIEVQFDVVCAG